MSLGFEYFDEQAESILADVAEFEPAGSGAQRKAPSARKPGAELPPMPNPYVVAVAMMTHDFEGQLEEMQAGLPPGMDKPEQMLKRSVTHWPASPQRVSNSKYNGLSCTGI